ncbi:hypothetical protein J6590_031622 [Homalodisca vitripennis]|nr:hypothetical protein J6590_031622 [Homalodisca vitripennis]
MRGNLDPPKGFILTTEVSLVSGKLFVDMISTVLGSQEVLQVSPSCDRNGVCLSALSLASRLGLGADLAVVKARPRRWETSRSGEGGVHLNIGLNTGFTEICALVHDFGVTEIRLQSGASYNNYSLPGYSMLHCDHLACYILTEYSVETVESVAP